MLTGEYLRNIRYNLIKMDFSMELRLKKLHPDAKVTICEYGSRINLYARLDNPVLLNPNMRRLIPTGIVVELPDHTEAQLRPERNMAIQTGITILDAPYTICQGDHHEIQILLVNLGDKGCCVKPGMAIAQMTLLPVCQPIVRFAESADAKQDEDNNLIHHLTYAAVNHSKIGALTFR